MSTVLKEDLYPSRVYQTPKIINRQDPVIHSAEGTYAAGPLERDQLETYESKGFLFLEHFFSLNEVKEMREELQEICDLNRHESAPELIKEPESNEIRSIFNIHRNHEYFNRLSRHPRLVNMVYQLLGSDVYITQSRVNFKPGFIGKEFYWHSDFETWHVEDGMPRMRAVSCSIILTDNTLHNGPLMLIPGSHKYFISCVGETPQHNYKSSLRKQEVGVPDHDSMHWLVDNLGIETPTGPAGSILLFECNTMHGSNSNITPLGRTNLFMVYNSIENELVEPFSGMEPRPEFIANRDIDLIQAGFQHQQQ